MNVSSFIQYVKSEYYVPRLRHWVEWDVHLLAHQLVALLHDAPRGDADADHAAAWIWRKYWHKFTNWYQRIIYNRAKTNHFFFFFITDIHTIRSRNKRCTAKAQYYAKKFSPNTFLPISSFMWRNYPCKEKRSSIMGGEKSLARLFGHGKHINRSRNLLPSFSSIFFFFQREKEKVSVDQPFGDDS